MNTVVFASQALKSMRKWEERERKRDTEGGRQRQGEDERREERRGEGGEEEGEEERKREREQRERRRGAEREKRERTGSKRGRQKRETNRAKTFLKKGGFKIPRTFWEGLRNTAKNVKGGPGGGHPLKNAKMTVK